MFKKYFENLSIHKIGFISANIIITLIFIFAILVINQEYKRYEKEIITIEKKFKNSDETKQQVIKERKAEHKKKVKRYIIGIGGIFMFMLVTIFMLLRVVSYFIENELNLFINKLTVSTKEYKKMKKEDFNFEESKSIVENANELIDEILQSHQKLLELNTTLEQKVKDKTKKLRNLVTAQDEFVKKSIHEINTPLSIILTNINLLKIQNIQNKNITNIESGLKIIHNIFNDLSFMIKKDRIKYKRANINFSQFLKQRLEFFSEIANANGLIFVTNIECGIIIKFNDIKLQRVVDNNLSNAIKYSFEDSPIYITLIKKDEDILFEIKTNSKQIQTPTKIFNDYYREDGVKGGFGIGLYIVKEICDKNRVKIGVISDKNETIFNYKFRENFKDENTTT